MAGTSLGTAWIQIKPSMTGMTSAIRAELSNVGTSEGASLGNRFSTGFAAKMGAVAGITQKVFGKITSAISGSFNSAISRMDTLNNYPAVMTALGYSSEEASSSIGQIGDALDGLPTSLDGMVNDVQKLAATMGNLAEGEVNATTVGLGLNNMLLAGGKGTEVASAAMEQYNQMLATGKVDMQSWRSMVNAAPGQMDQLAKSILGATANQGDLYEAMKNGNVTFDELNTKIVELNEQGGEGFSSFYDQAVAATGGVATQLENVQNTMNKIVAAALEGDLTNVNNYIGQLVDRIGAVAPTLIQGFTGAFGALTKALPTIIVELLPALMDGITALVNGVFEAIPAFADAIIQSIPIIIDGIDTLLRAIMEALPVFLPQLIDAIVQAELMIVQLITQPQFLSDLFEAALTLFMELVHAVPRTIVMLIDALPQILTNIIEFLTSPDTIKQLILAAVDLFMSLVMAVPQILGALIGAFGNLVGNLWNGITSMFGEFASNFGSFISDIFKGAINGILGFIEGFINMPINILNGFLDIINGAFGWLGVNLSHIEGIKLPRLYTGGIVEGVGTDTSDSNLYALSRGEYVIRAAAAREIGYDNLERMNETGEISSGQNISITINGYNKSPEELANIISRKIAFNQRGVMA